MSKQSRSIAALASILTFAGAVIAAQSSAKKIDTYTWSGELVSLDAPAKTMTVKSRVVYQDAVPELKQFKAGDRVWIVEREGRRLLIAGDTAHTSAFSEHRRFGPFDAAVMPIGAYDPWIASHCTPEEAVDEGWKLLSTDN